MSEKLIVPRAGISSALRDLTSKLSKFVKISAKNSAEEVSIITKSVSTGTRSIDDIIKALPVKRTKNGLITIGDETVGTINRVIREANLAKLAELAKYGKPITATEKSLFRELVGETAERTLKDISDATVSSVKSYPKLNVGAEGVSALKGSDKAVVEKVQSNFLKRFKQGLVIPLAIGAVYVGVDWLVKATAKRKGCFMLTTINGKTTSCKVAAYTCTDNSAEGTLCGENLPYYNTTLILMKIVTLSNTDANKLKIAQVTGFNVNDLESKLATIIDTKYAEVSDAIADMKNRPVLNVCGIKSNDVEGGNIPACRMCSPSDDPTSTTFIDPSQFGSNITFHCSINPSILDTINDVVVTTGENIWGGITGNILGPLKRGLIIIAIIAVVAMILFGAIRFGMLQMKNKPHISNFPSQMGYKRILETEI